MVGVATGVGDGLALGAGVRETLGAGTGGPIGVGLGEGVGKGGGVAATRSKQATAKSVARMQFQLRGARDFSRRPAGVRRTRAT
jgi:hypothetical protein